MSIPNELGNWSLTCDRKKEKMLAFDSFTPMSDQERISLYNNSRISSRQVMRLKEKIDKGINTCGWSNTWFSKLTS